MRGAILSVLKPIFGLLLVGSLTLFSTMVGCAGDDGNDPGVLGSEAANILSTTSYPKFVVEIDYVEGYAPDAKAYEFVKKVISEVMEKPGGADVYLDTVLPPMGEDHEYLLTDIKAIEKEHRSTYRGGDTVAMYFLFLDGRYQGDTDTLMTLGLAYSGSSMVMFKNNFAKVCAPLVAANEDSPDIAELLCPLSEGTTWVHEMGHLMGLVNTGTEMVTPHQDPDDHGAHCDNPDCIMFWLNNTTSMMDTIIQRIETGNKDFFPFDGNCLADLEAMGSQ
jgi:hypothetical protein